NFALGHDGLGSCYMEKGDYEQALAEFKKTNQLSPDEVGYLTRAAQVYARSGKREEAEKALLQLNELTKQQYVSPVGISTIYTALGDKDHAFEWLEKAFAERSPQLLDIGNSPNFQRLHEDQRFGNLLKRIGLPQS